jgi:HrpA-like RNA helicase
VDVRVGKLLLLASGLGCLAPALTVAAALSYKSPFSAPWDQQDAAQRAKQALAAPGGRKSRGCSGIDSLEAAASRPRMRLSGSGPLGLLTDCLCRPRLGSELLTRVLRAPPPLDQLHHCVLDQAAPTPHEAPAKQLQRSCMFWARG